MKMKRVHHFFGNVQAIKSIKQSVFEFFLIPKAPYSNLYIGKMSGKKQTGPLWYNSLGRSLARTPMEQHALKL